MSETPAERYSMRVEWSEKDQAFRATCPAFPGLSAFGEAREEALKEAGIALELVIEDYEEEGEELPAPREALEYSGQTRLRMPPQLHQALAEEANRQGVSLNMLLVSFLSKQLGREEQQGAHEEQLMAIGKYLRTVLPEAVGTDQSSEVYAPSGREYQDPAVRRAKSGNVNE